MGKIREDRHVTRDTFIWCNSSLERSSREYFAIQPIQLLWCWTLIANLWYLLGMEKIGKDRDRSHTPCDITASRTTSRVISRNRVSCYQDVWHRNKKSRSDVARALYMFGWGLFFIKKQRRGAFKKIASGQGTRPFRGRLLKVPIGQPCFTTINSASYLFNFQPSD